MKRLSYLAVIAILLSVSCKKTGTPKDALAQNELEILSETAKKQFHIFYATWTEWGRKSRNCDGWGLCNFQSCWFCCTDENGNVVNCKDEIALERAGKIMIEEGSQDGELIIELNPDFADQKQAIELQEVLYFDEDLSNEQFIFYKGEYKFDPTVGAYGGYKVPATKKN